MWITGKTQNSQNSVRKKRFGGTFSLSNCDIIELDTGSLVLIVFGRRSCFRSNFLKNLLLEGGATYMDNFVHELSC
jgi:hypothetical protein